MEKRSRRAFAASLFTLALLAGCDNPPNVVRIGVAQPCRGRLPHWGRTCTTA